MNPQDLAQFGVAGLAVFLMYKLAGNHIEHARQAIEDLKEAVKENTAMVRGLVNYLNSRSRDDG